MYGDRDRGPERFPDWLLGDRRWQIIDRLAREGPGWKAQELIDDLGGGDTWIYEVLRALRPTDALQSVERGRYRLAHENALAAALRDLARALRPLADLEVDRPPSRKR